MGIFLRSCVVILRLAGCGFWMRRNVDLFGAEVTC